MRRIFWAAALLWPAVATADIPRVLADTPPLHALVARVMAGVAEPDLLLPPGTSPHTHSMRPSQATALDQAEVVFWVGPELTPWLERPIKSLAPDATVVALLHADGTEVRSYRWGEDVEDGGGHGHDHAHEAGAEDPHAWFDPANAEAWLSAIASALSHADPPRAAVYAGNAAAGQAELRVLRAELQADLDALRDVQMIVYHDAFQYFEGRFGLQTIGAMTRGESAPSPRHLAELRDLAAMTQVCIVLEPQTDPGLAGAVAQASGARHVTVDTQGLHLSPGAGFYPALLRSLAAGLRQCL